MVDGPAARFMETIYLLSGTEMEEVGIGVHDLMGFYPPLEDIWEEFHETFEDIIEHYCTTHDTTLEEVAVDYALGRNGSRVAFYGDDYPAYYLREVSTASPTLRFEIMTTLFMALVVLKEGSEVVPYVEDEY